MNTEDLYLASGFNITIWIKLVPTPEFILTKPFENSRKVGLENSRNRGLEIVEKEV